MEKNVLPKKIKIAIFLMLAIGILAFVQFIFMISMIKMGLSQIDYPQYSILTVILKNLEILLVAILFIVFAYFLKKRKKWAWFAAMVILLKETVAGIKAIPLLFSVQLPHLGYLMEHLPPLISIFLLIAMIASLFSYILVLLSLIILISERKKYWQIAS